MSAIAVSLLLLACRDDEGGGRRHHHHRQAPEPTAVEPVPEATGDTGAPTAPALPPECLEPPPARARRVETLTVQTEEDFDFDDRGRLLAQRYTEVVGITRDLEVEVVAARGWADPSGLRTLPDGRFLAVEQDLGGVRVFDPATGAARVVLTGLTRPNGLVTDRAGRGYVSEFVRGGRVISFDPDGDDAVEVGTFREPNGLAFSPDERTLYVTTVSGSHDTTIVAIDRDDDGKFLRATRRDLWSDHYDLLSLAVDVCGNLYSADYSRDTVLRIAPDGVAVELGEARGSGHSAVRFAPGLGGWERTHLHVNARSDSKLDIIDVGLPGYHLLTPAE